MYGLTSDDDQFGGFPAVVFELSSLEELYLDNQAITHVPPQMNQLQNLRYLSLNHNALLESLQGSIGHLPNLKSKILLNM
jgi:Leucine-rich repeat (LRR) protein